MPQPGREQDAAEYKQVLHEFADLQHKEARNDADADRMKQLREQIALDSHDARALLDSIGPDDLRRAPK